jgi:trk system potassium uptake protein
MNIKSIFYVLGNVLAMTGLFMLLPAAVAFGCGEYSNLRIFLLLTAGCILLSFPIIRRRAMFTRFTTKDGYVAVALSWIVMSVVGCLPFVISGEIPFFLDALFEIVSGFTTTGASILSDVEALSSSMMFWRCFTHWIGGMGVLVFILTILPMAKSGSSFALMQAESPGPVVSKLVPKLRASARFLYGIYLGFTVLLIILLALGGVPLLDNLCLSFGTMGTGGFSVLNSGCATYSPYVQWVLAIFMLIAGTNFGLYFLLLYRQWRAALRMEEVRWYYIIVFLAVVLICLNLYTSGQFTSVREVVFQVASIITTTGFSSTDFDLWPEFSKTILITLMFIGGCAGSTGGGIKVSRILIFAKTAVREVRELSQPRLIRTVRMDGKKLENRVIRGTLLFLTAYVLIFFLSLLIVTLDKVDFNTGFTAVAATLNNIGPGLGAVGPTCNFGFLSPLSKIVLIFDMLAGRLELFPLLILFAPKTWSK